MTILRWRWRSSGCEMRDDYDQREDEGQYRDNSGKQWVLRTTTKERESVRRVWNRDMMILLMIHGREADGTPTETEMGRWDGATGMCS